MKKVQFLSVVILILTNVFSCAQHIENGIYSSKHDHLCIQNETILYSNNDISWYIGTYKILDTVILLGNNELLGKNAIITREQCNKDTIEIRLITKFKNYVFGESDIDTTIYQDESPLYQIVINKTILRSRDKEGVFITRGRISQEELSTMGFWAFDEGNLSGFQDYFNIPLEFGTRYIVKQIYHDFSPLLINEQNQQIPEIKYNKNNKEFIITYHNQERDDIITKFKYVTPNVDSCFNELKNRFPLLFKQCVD